MVLVKEFVDFLGAHAPYDALDPEDLQKLAREVEVEYFPAGAVVVAAGTEPLKHMFVVRAGAVEVVDRGRVVDVLGEGDTFGHVSVLSGLPPVLAVRAGEGTVVYRLPDPRPVIGDPAKLRFAHHATLAVRERLTAATLLETARRPVGRYVRPVLWAQRSTTIQEAARLADDAGQSCLLVETDFGLGMVTDRDFRRFLAGGTGRSGAPVAEIASGPLRSVPAETTVSSAFLEMVEHGIHHLVVTGRGDRPVGIVRVVDLASAQVRDPLLVRAMVDEATTVLELARAASLLPATAVELDDSGVPPTQIAALLSTVVDAILHRIVDMEVQRSDGLPSPHSWMVLGSRARREPLPGSDVDSALIWADPGDPVDPAPTMHALARRVLTAVEACGFHRCPDGANATNPLFSRSTSQWSSATSRWVAGDPTRDDALLLSSIVTDSRPITGAATGRGVVDGMLAAATGQELLGTLLRLTVAYRPPTGFVRDFVVEHSGEHRGQLDLKRGGLLPVASLGRWIAVAVHDSRGATPERLRRGAAAGLLTSGEADALVGAFEQVFGLLFDREVAAIRSGGTAGEYVAPGELDPLTRRFLRETFREIAHVQRELESNWLARLR